MKQCLPIQNKRRGICAGDLSSLIKIHLRNLTAPKTSVDFSETMTEIIETWAMIATSRGSELFDGSNLSNAYTHIFYIRFPPVTLNKDCWVEFNSKHFEIIDIENLDERGEFAAIRCNEKGATSLPVNQI